MKVHPPKLEISPDDPFKDALFERKDFALSLTSLIRQSEDNLVIFINALWGQGKTTFARMWLAHLKTQKLDVIYYDAYASDYFDDPFLSFTGEILALVKKRLADVEGVPQQREELKRSAAEISKRIIGLGTRIGVKAATLGVLGVDEMKELGELGSEFTTSAGDIFSEVIEKRLENYVKEKDSLEVFKVSLAKLAKRMREVQGFTDNSAVAEFDVLASSLADSHADILALDLEALRGAKDVTFISYLGKEVDTFTTSYGFSLRFGDFTIADKTETKRRWITLTDLDGNQQVAFLGARSYSAQWLAGKMEHVVEISADSNGFLLPPLRPSAFPVGFAVTFTWKDKKLRDHIEQAADDAQVAGLLSGVDQASAEAVLGSVPSKSQLGDIVLSVRVPPDLTPLLLEELAVQGGAMISRALAMALPGVGQAGTFRERKTPEARSATYAPIFDAFLAERPTLDDYRIDVIAGKVLRTQPLALRDAERFNPISPGSGPQWAVGSIVRQYGPLENSNPLADAVDRPGAKPQQGTT